MSSFYVITQYIIYDCLFYFNPRSREGSDALTLTALTCPKISIRVPTRGATGMALHHCVGNTISIRAPARGATGIWRVAERFPNISICAPARGATSRSVHTRRRINHFNPRSHEGSDITGMANVRHQKAFQSALPRGERPAGAFTRADGSIISIRAPARGTTRSAGNGFAPCTFQSALPRGERLHTVWHM